MLLTLDTERLRTLAEVHAFLDGSDPVEFRLANRDDACAFAGHRSPARGDRHLT